MPRRVPQYLPLSWLRDIGPALVIGLVEVAAVPVLGQYQPARRPIDSAAITLLAIGAAALVYRRWYPVLVLVVVPTVTLLYWILDYPRAPIFLPAMVAVFTAATSGHRAVAWGSLLIGFVGFTWVPYLLGNDVQPGAPAIFGLAGWMMVLAVAAEVVRVRRERELVAVSAREEEARRQIVEQRVTIAREMHDVLAHSIALINVQAAVALHLIDERPEQARTALTAIKDVSKDALRELRSVLEALRQGDEPPLRGPTPSLAHLDDLVSRAATGGLAIHTRIEGDLDSLPASVDLAAYRILQEALTNVIRHARAASATVRVMLRGDELTLEVDDEGVAAGPSDNGHSRGILGMQERASALGGILEAGPRPEGGFRVLARLPLNGAP